MTRAREGPRKLRKGRNRCTAHRRDGQPCQAPAIPGGLVCLRHGGSAPQVRLAAQRLLLLERRYFAWQAVEQAEKGTRRWREVLYRACDADRALEQFDDDLDLIRLMEIEIRDPGGPEIRRMLLERARERLAR